jgi:hypothetical protein
MNFISKWPEKDITAYVKKHKVLVLFDKNKDNTADVIVYGKFKDSQKRGIKDRIFVVFGKQNITKQLCEKINEYAEKLYRKYLLGVQKSKEPKK